MQRELGDVIGPVVSCGIEGERFLGGTVAELALHYRLYIHAIQVKVVREQSDVKTRAK